MALRFRLRRRSADSILKRELCFNRLACSSAAFAVTIRRKPELAFTAVGGITGEVQRLLTVLAAPGLPMAITVIWSRSFFLISLRFSGTVFRTNQPEIFKRLPVAPASIRSHSFVVASFGAEVDTGIHYTKMPLPASIPLDGGGWGGGDFHPSFVVPHPGRGLFFS